MTNTGRILLIDETDAPGLVALFQKDLDEVRCDVCHFGFGVTPTIIVMFNGKTTMPYVLGTLMQDKHDALLFHDWRQTFPDHQELAPFLLQAPNVTELRQVVADWLSPRLEPFRALLTADGAGDGISFVARNWRLFTPTVLATAQLAAVTKTPQLSSLTHMEGKLTPPPGKERQFLNLATTPLDSERSLHDLALLQLYVWIGLLDTWESGGEEGHTFESDLTEYVEPNVILPTSADAFFVALEEFAGRVRGRFGLYVEEALRATICAAINRPNPHAQQWADAYFAHELAYHLADSSRTADLGRLRVSMKQVQATISHDYARASVASWIHAFQTEELLGGLAQLDPINHLATVASEAGFPGLVHAIVNDSLLVSSAQQKPIEVLIEEMRREAREMPPDRVLVWALPVIRPILEQGLINEFERFCDAMTKELAHSDSSRAMVDMWIGVILNNFLRQFRRTLDRLGEIPHPWEETVPVAQRAGLMQVRSHALQGMGRMDQALSLQEDAVDLLQQADGHDALQSALIDLAQIYLRTGSPVRAMKLLRRVMSESDPPQPSPHLLGQLAACHAALAEPAQALRYVEQALRLETADPFNAARLGAFRAELLVRLGDSGGAISTLLELPPQSPGSHGGVLLAEARTWVAVLARGLPLSSEARRRAAMQIGLLQQLQAHAAVRGDAEFHAEAAILVARLAQITGQEVEHELWNEADDVRRHYGMVANPLVLVQTARAAYARGALAVGRAQLSEIPQALAATYGETTDISVMVERVIELQRPLEQLQGQLMQPEPQGERRRWRRRRRPSFADVRLVAELQRDALGRATMLRRSEIDLGEPFVPGSWQVRRTDLAKLFANGLTGKLLARLAPASGGVAVVEWTSLTDSRADRIGLACLLTRIGSDASVTSVILEPLLVDPGPAGGKLQARLKDWYPGRPGDPFNLPEWRHFETWILQQLTKHLRGNEHVVFIQHRAYADIPWHVAVGPHFPCSYAPSWTSLLLMHAHLPAARPAPFGTILVPRYNEEPGLRDTMNRSWTRTLMAMPTVGTYPPIAPRFESCDREAFEMVMKETYIAKLICHGYVDPGDGEMGFMLAHEGRLPLAHSVAAGHEEGRLHRLSWKECQSLSRAPRVVFSAACSTGSTYFAGLGERLGLFSALRQAGTTSLVAPGWDIVADQVLPILDDTIEMFLERKQLGHSLRSACQNAVINGCPTWLAWALTLEGDWR